MTHELIEFNGEKIYIPHAECYKDCITLIRSDFYRPNRKKKSIIIMFLKTLYDS